MTCIQNSDLHMRYTSQQLSGQPHCPAAGPSCKHETSCCKAARLQWRSDELAVLVTCARKPGAQECTSAPTAVSAGPHTSSSLRPCRSASMPAGKFIISLANAYAEIVMPTAAVPTPKPCRRKPSAICQQTHHGAMQTGGQGAFGVASHVLKVCFAAADHPIWHSLQIWLDVNACFWPRAYACSASCCMLQIYCIIRYIWSP